MKSIAGVLFFLMAFNGFVASGQDAERDILARTEQTLAGLDSFQTDFEQSFFSMTVSEPLREKGRLFYQKPGRMRWEYRGGSSQIVVLNDGVMETFDPGENQLIRQKIPEEQANGAIFGLLSGRTHLAETYQVEKSPFPGAEGPVHQLKLTPVEEGETAYILVEIDARTYFLRRVILFDWAGNKNEFAFSRLKTNPRLGPDVFTIKVPDGCEIIDDVAFRQR
jgi:outer membrane lipoprotein carrier protein